MADPGTVLALVLAGHLVGDWVVQTDRHAAGKTWPRPEGEPGAARLAAGLDPRFVGVRPRDYSEWLTPGMVRAALSVRRRLWWRSVWANQAHMLGYHLTVAALVLPVWHSWSTAVLLAVSWASHSFIDRRWPVRWLMRHTGSAAFAATSWGVMAVDQALHIAILMLLGAALAGG